MTLGDSATGRPESPRALRQLWRSIDFAASIAMAIAAVGGTMLTALDLALDIGVDLGSPVSRDYFRPQSFPVQPEDRERNGQPPMSQTGSDVDQRHARNSASCAANSTRCRDITNSPNWHANDIIDTVEYRDLR